MVVQSPERVELIHLHGEHTLHQLRKMVGAYLKRASLPLFFDIETTGLDARQDKLICLQFHQVGHPVVVADVRRIAPRALCGVLQPLFNAGIVVGMNLKFDSGFLLAQSGIVIPYVYDVMLAEQLIRGLGKSDAASQDVHFNLKWIAKQYGLPVSKEERNWFVGLDQRPEWNQTLPIEQIEYAAQDVRVLGDIMAKQTDLLKAKGLVDAAALEFSALPAITSIEVAGVHVDVEQWRGIIAEVAEEANRVEEEAISLFGPAILSARARKYDAELAAYNSYIEMKAAEEKDLRRIWELEQSFNDPPEVIGWGAFKTREMKKWREEHPNPGKPKQDTSLPNIGSHAQMVAAFREMGIVRKVNERGVWVERTLDTTADDVLAELEDEHPALKVLRRSHKLSKFVTSFGESLLKFIDPTTGRIHPEYVQIGASTGRMSCSRPNWQQIPSRDETGQKLRRCVVAEPGNVLLTCDYPSIEPRILAELTGDETLLQIFADGKDIYSEIAKMVLGLSDVPNFKKVYKKERSLFKIIVLAISYGMGPTSMAKQAGISKEDAEKHIAEFFRRFPKVKAWSDKVSSQVHLTGESRTVSGRARYYELPKEPRFPRENRTPEAVAKWREEMRSYNQIRAGNERKAKNTPIQGSSADITKLALALLWSRIRDTQKSTVNIIAVVHDEVVVECRREDAEQVAPILASAMLDACTRYLKKVVVPVATEDVVIDTYWRKE